MTSPPKPDPDVWVVAIVTLIAFLVGAGLTQLVIVIVGWLF